MKVRDVMAEAADLVCDDGLGDKIRLNEETSGEDERKRKILLRAYNTVLNEMCTEYLPLRTRENVGEGKIFYADLSYDPVRIVAAYDDEGRKISVCACPTYAVAAGAKEIEYEYIPSAKGEADDHPYDGTRVGSRVFAYGIAAEYCLVTARYEESTNWDEKYRGAATGCLTRKGAKRIPARTWGL